MRDDIINVTEKKVLILAHFGEPSLILNIYRNILIGLYLTPARSQRAFC